GHRAHRTAQEDPVLFTRTASLLRTSRFRDTNSYNEKITLPRVPPSTLEFGCVTDLVPKDLFRGPGLGNINPIPFRRAARQHEHVFAFRGRRLPRSERIFSDPLGQTEPKVQLLVYKGKPLFQLHPQGSHLILLLTTKICTGGGPQAGSRPGTFNAAPRGPSYSPAAFKTPTREASPFP
ncbi:hypothetical protein JTE90_020885, partial [Oedothorax gibbosus]